MHDLHCTTSTRPQKQHSLCILRAAALEGVNLLLPSNCAAARAWWRAWCWAACMLTVCDAAAWCQTPHLHAFGQHSRHTPILLALPLGCGFCHSAAAAAALLACPWFALLLPALLLPAAVEFVCQCQWHWMPACSACIVVLCRVLHHVAPHRCLRCDPVGQAVTSLSASVLGPFASVVQAPFGDFVCVYMCARSAGHRVLWSVPSRHVRVCAVIRQGFAAAGSTVGSSGFPNCTSAGWTS